MKLLCKFFLSVAAIVGMAANVNATTIHFHATLSGAQEVPPTPSPATGISLAVLDDVQNTLSVMLLFAGLTTPATAAHIHCCAAPGANGPVAVPLMVPLATSGSYSNTFDLDTFTFPSPAVTTASFIAGLKAGLAYINIHNPTYPGGEIRGQLIPQHSTSVPEPGTLGLMSLVLLAIGWRSRRTR